MAKSLKDLLEMGTRRLHAADVCDPELDARLLLEHASGLSRTELYLRLADLAEAKILEEYHLLVEKRSRRIPLAYITGCQEFWSLSLKVSPDVLIPRPETEFLLEQIFTRSRPENLRGRTIDICSGSGAIALILALETGRPVHGLDLSKAALAIARENGRRHGLAHLLTWIQGDMLTALRKEPLFSLVVSNPPYIRRFDLLQNLEPEVALHEPSLALDGGEDGLDYYRRLARQLPRRLQPGAEVFLEIGADQGDAVKTIFSGASCCGFAFTGIEVIQDYNNCDRVVHASWSKA